MILEKVILPQRAQFDALNLKFLNSSQIYAPTLIRIKPINADHKNRVTLDKYQGK